MHGTYEYTQLCLQSKKHCPNDQNLFPILPMPHNVDDSYHYEAWVELGIDFGNLGNASSIEDIVECIRMCQALHPRINTASVGWMIYIK